MDTQKINNSFQFKDFNVLKSYFNRIDGYVFNEEDLEFELKGVYNKYENLFLLNFSFLIKNKSNAETIDDLHMLVETTGLFEVYFENKEEITTENLPSYFLTNAPALMFPYIRSYITTLTANSNFGSPIILPTLNISGLKDILKDNINIIDEPFVSNN